MSGATWQALGRTPPSENVRLAAHWAAQLPAALGAAAGKPTEDYAHFALTWDSERGALVCVEPDKGLEARAGLSIDRLQITVWGRNGEELESFGLTGVTVAQALERLSAHVPGSLKLFEHEMPSHELGDGVPFPAVDAEALRELSRWYENAHVTLHDWAPKLDGAGPVRCWPHHFDIATLISLGGEKTIGVGMSPGDGDYPEPYWYVTPWPYPDSSDLPQLDGHGKWHTHEWVGAVLTASELTTAAADEQRARLDAFIGSATRACRELAG